MLCFFTIYFPPAQPAPRRKKLDLGLTQAFSGMACSSFQKHRLPMIDKNCSDRGKGFSQPIGLRGQEGRFSAGEIPAPA